MSRWLLAVAILLPIVSIGTAGKQEADGELPYNLTPLLLTIAVRDEQDKRG